MHEQCSSTSRSINSIALFYSAIRLVHLVLTEVGKISSVDRMRATFSHSGKTGKIALNVPRDMLFPNDSTMNYTTRFNHFMSLIPMNNSYIGDYLDNSRMKGWMENLKICSSSWLTTNLQYVWNVQDEKSSTDLNQLTVAT